MADDTRVTRSRSGIAWTLALFWVLGCTLPAHALAADIIVRRDAGLSASERAAVRADAGVKLQRMLALPDAEVVTVPDGRQSSALATLNADPDVRYAEPVVRFNAAATNDPDWGKLWALENTGQPILRRPGTKDADMDVPEAWAFGRGTGQVVAVIDTGIDIDHPDLAGHIAPGGRSFVTGVSSFEDDNGHGTNVAGVIAADADNGLGVAGVAPDAKLLPLKALKADGSGDSRSVGEALNYAGLLGIRLVNLSLGGPNDSQFMRDAMAAHPQTLYIVPAGNGDDYSSYPDEIPFGDDNDGPRSENSGPEYPCNFPLANVICVGATDNQDSVTSWSNFGSVSVDLFAPGQSIYTTLLNGGYYYRSGTSLSAPLVAGEAALVLAAHPKLTAASLRQLLLATVDPIPSAAGLSVTGGRANAGNAATVPVADADDDGVLDNLDDCRTVADPVQSDADADALGDACDPTPRGPDADGDGKAALDDSCPELPGDLPNGCPSPPAANPPSQSPPVQLPRATPPIPTPKPATRILSLAVKISPSKCPKAHAGCLKSAKVTVKLSGQDTVALKVERRIKRKGRWVWQRVTSKSVTASTGGTSLTVRGRRGKPLSYRVTATLGAAAKAARFRV
jgi:subtilisin family serine protease